jgi:hypothetical protein
MEEKRKRGAPPGNHNALKHGYYSKAYKRADRHDFFDAAGIKGIDEEIALLRHELKKAISGGDDRNLKVLERAAASLEKLVRTRSMIKDSQTDGLQEAIETSLRDSLVPLGINYGGADADKNGSRLIQSDSNTGSKAGLP